MGKIVFVGDIHGQLDEMYKRVAQVSSDVQAIVQVGDFEAIRTPSDISNVLGPKKYRNLGDFSKYHNEEKLAPVPTYFIGGNHEDYDFLDQNHPEGFDVAPRIHYLGRSGVIEIEGVKIGFLSGIYAPDKFDRKRKFSNKSEGIHSGKSRRKAIYFNKEDVSRIGECDVLIAHDPPGTIQEREYNPIDEIIQKFTPKLAVFGHLHYPIESAVNNQGKRTEIRVLAHVGKEGDTYILEV